MSPPKAITGITDPSKARLVYWGGTEYQHAPADAVGYQPLDADLTTIAGLTPAAGAVMIGDGSNWTADTTPTLTGLLTVNGQIAFPVTQNPSSDPNTLDDYEVGTYTPTVTSSLGTITTIVTNGAYVKIGDLVFFRAGCLISNNGTGAGSLNFTLPFTAGQSCIVVGRELLVNGHSQTGTISNSSATCPVVKYDNSYPGGTGTAVTISGCFPV